MLPSLKHWRINQLHICRLVSWRLLLCTYAATGCCFETQHKTHPIIWKILMSLMLSHRAAVQVHAFSLPFPTYTQEITHIPSIIYKVHLVPDLRPKFHHRDVFHWKSHQQHNENIDMIILTILEQNHMALQSIQSKMNSNKDNLSIGTKQQPQWEGTQSLPKQQPQREGRQSGEKPSSVCFFAVWLFLLTAPFVLRVCVVCWLLSRLQQFAHIDVFLCNVQNSLFVKTGISEQVSMHTHTHTHTHTHKCTEKKSLYI